ncbi:MAG: phosphate ABC transporter permease PstA [Thermoguttaceae bacterium]
MHRSLFWRKFQQHLVDLVSFCALIFAVGLMIWIIATLIWFGGKTLNWEFLTCVSKPYGIPNQGIGNALLGTFYITAFATLIAVPVGLLGGIYLAEFDRHSMFADWVRFSANVTMGIPSIVVGLFIYAIWVVPTGQFSGLAGSFALAIIMLPIILRTTEDMLLMVPDALREATLALGIPRWRGILKVICRSAMSGLITGILMSFARVSGETAPLLFTALWSYSWPYHFFTSPVANIPVLVTEYTTGSPFAERHAAGWGAALVMMMIILFINIGVRILFQKHAKN